MITPAGRAVIARERLLGLGSAAAEWAELSAAGVSQVTINSLYPSTFAAFVPSLITRLTAHAAAKDLSAFASADRKLKRLLRQLPGELARELDADYTNSLSQQIELYELHDYLAKRLSQPATVEIGDGFTPQRLRLDAINRSIWQVHWLTVNYHRLPVSQQAIVDQLAVRLAELVELS